MEHTHFVAIVIYRRDATYAEVDLLVIDSRSTSPKTGVTTLWQTKFIGGTNFECFDEPVSGTRDRELLEEAGLVLSNSRKIWEKEASRDHTKYGFLVDIADCNGELRKEVLFDNGDELSKPYWHPARTLGRILFHSHQELYLVAGRELHFF